VDALTPGLAPALLRAAGVVLAIVAGAGSASAADAGSPYPARPVRIIVPYPAGGGPDIIARRIAESLGPRLGQTIVVDNRPGAAGGLGLQIAAKSPADGHTLAYLSASHVAPEILGGSTNVRRDFEPITQVSETPSVLVVRGGSPYRSVDDLLRDLRARPGKLAYGSSGVGNAGHLAVGLLASLTGGFSATHVPYKGGVETIPPLVNGQLDFCILVVPITLPHLASGRLRAIAVTLAERFPGLPEVPTLESIGVKGYRFSSWGGVAAPGTVDPRVAGRLHREIAGLLADAQIRTAFIALGSVATPSASPAAFKATVEEEFGRMRRLVGELGIKPE
jgi:tripartite-type tricarboxylate transporter receptor subunit TctC